MSAQTTDKASSSRPPRPILIGSSPAINARDRKSDALTAADQSDKPEDIAVTQHIRQSIVADKNLSTDGKNVKIITIDGAVTLRGPVRDAFEKQLIEKAAIKVAG